jgi:predicted metal-dependent enzyme (double-stranded beta helix superfamily)
MKMSALRRHDPISITSDTTLDTNQTLDRTGSGLTALVAAVRQAVSVQLDWTGTAELVADALRRHLPGPDVLTSEQRRGNPERFQSHTLHVETGGSFSVVAFVWRPGQVTRIHDHLTWCVFGVVEGIEYEELFDAHGTRLGESSNHPGEVSGFAPPGDIHRVRNVGSTTAISIHVYGTDVDRVGSGVRRYYDDER